MGAVYRATDTKLNRDVAIKVLPGTFGADPERLARFQREAQLLASLNHPNIAAIYGVEASALVLELVEGQTLAELIARGPAPMDQALRIAQQICEAIEYAHERGIIHRDLKPANVKVTPEGRVKVLDFGLAKALSAAAGDPVSSPTLTMCSTDGAIVGTAAYLAPEGARGQPADRRGDIWAFGVVLYEMLTGRRLFSGPTISDTLAAVLNADIDLSAIPERVRYTLERCLRKDASQRWQSIGDVRIALQEAPPPAPQPLARRNAPWIAAAAFAMATAASGVGWWRASRPVTRPYQRLNVDLGPDAVFNEAGMFAISPDGTGLVFTVQTPEGTRLAMRPLDQPGTLLLPGTENASEPFFSPDGQWIGFFAGGKMKKIATRGGPPVTLCDAPAPRGASWGDNGEIVASFNPTGGLFRVPDHGGTPAALTRPDENGEVTHRWPQFLPGSRTVLFTSHTGFDLDNATISALSISSGKWKTVLTGGYGARYLPSGHLVFAHQETLFAVPFDPDRLEVRGTPLPVLEKDSIASQAIFGSGHFDFSRNGSFLYVTGRAREQHPLVWLDHAGRAEALIPTPAHYITPRFSPDGKRLAVDGFAAAETDIWIYDLQRRTPQRLTFTGQNYFPVWTPDGSHIVFSSQRSPLGIWWIRADGGGEAIRLYEAKALVRAHSFSPDGRRLAFSESSPETGTDLWTLPLDISDPEHPKPGKPAIFLRTPSNEVFPAFSPDGRWIAYQSNESGSEQIYVRPFPGPGGHWQVSTGGGQFPIWSPNRRELFFQNLANQTMSVEYTATGGSFDAGMPRVWSDGHLLGTVQVPTLDLAPDGKRFVGPPFDAAGVRPTVHVTFLINFFDELKRRMP